MTNSKPLRKGPSGPVDDSGDSFLGLEDTPDLYPVRKNKAPIVNRESDGLIFETQELNSAQSFYACADGGPNELSGSGCMRIRSIASTSFSSVDKDGVYLRMEGTSNADIYSGSRELGPPTSLETDLLLKFKLGSSSNIRFFSGLSTNTSLQILVIADPTVARVGVSYSTTAAQTNFQFVTCDGSGVSTFIDSGIEVTTDAFYVRVANIPSKPSFNVELLDAKFAVIASHEFSFNVPSLSEHTVPAIAMNTIAATYLDVYFLKAVFSPL